jgi:hypothetical protein
MRQNFLALLTSRYQQKPLTILWISMRIGGPPQKTKNPHHFNSERVLKLPEGSELHVLGALPGIEYCDVRGTFGRLFGAQLLVSEFLLALPSVSLTMQFQPAVARLTTVRLRPVADLRIPPYFLMLYIETQISPMLFSLAFNLHRIQEYPQIFDVNFVRSTVANKTI